MLRRCLRCPSFLAPGHARCPDCGSAAPALPGWLKLVGGGALSAVLAACYGASYPRGVARTPYDLDEDGDGYAAQEDCDDTSPKAHPGATELPGDGVDLDCDGADD